MLKGKTAVITGGSRGIGAAIALKFASLGANIAVIYSGNAEAATETCRLCQAHGVKAIPYRCNVVDFSAVKVVCLDEYVGVPAGDPHTFRYFLGSCLFDCVNLPSGNIFYPDGMAQDLQAECDRYDHIIEDLGGIDLQLLGLGYNGHIGFNEPGSAFEKTTHCVRLAEGTRRANARYFDSMHDVPTQALTLGIKSIMQAKKILLIVSGEDKSYVLEQALFGPVTPRVPASILQLHPDVTVVEHDALRL